MPNFRADWTAGVTLGTWTDPAKPAVAGPPPVPEQRSRLNPSVGHPMHYVRAEVGVEVTASAILGSTVGPMDAALGGDLFTAHLAEHASAWPIVPTLAAGQSSVVSFTPPTAGHYLLVITRANGGAIGLHLDAVDP